MLLLSAARALKDYANALVEIDTLRQENQESTDLLLEQLDLLIAAWANGSINQDKLASNGGIVNDALIDKLPNNQQKATAYLYRGLVRYVNKDYDNALRDLDSALADRDSGIGHYYRGLTLEQLKRDLDAIRDYQWLQFWAPVYAFDFMDDVEKRVVTLESNLPTATWTITPSPTRTLTPSRTPTLSPTPSLTPSETNTPTPSLTSTITPTFTPSRTPTPSRTFTPSRTPTSTRTPTLTRTPSLTRTPRP
jgi:hypothetical protein